ncbi:MAG: EamA family transporter [Sphingomonadales bacterium]|nr:EamA family transporter [Sphingomonadales bacterium]MDE2168574.1 EamA family transporter [Sphingomonadales bacterium]
MTNFPLWMPITLAACFGQVLRNGAQAELTPRIGTLGATQVRFVYGLPFSLCFLGLALLATGDMLPHPGWTTIGWVVTGALAQIAATALMLLVMDRRAFGVAYAYIKTEPVMVAIMGVALLGEVLPPLGWLAAVVVTGGVLIASLKPDDLRGIFTESRMIGVGLASGALFGLSSLAFRGAINTLHEGHIVTRSLTMLVVSKSFQVSVLAIWLAWRRPDAFIGSIREWRRSFRAGFLSAASSSCWFCAFALAPVADVRTLALAELPMAALMARRMTGKKPSRQQWVGIWVVLAGLGLLILAQKG